MSGSLFGTYVQVPVDLGYAVTIHKGQRLTIRKEHAWLEGLFAHGQLYVQKTRTPFQRLPPRDLLPPILQRVIQQQQRITDATQWLMNSLDDHNKVILETIALANHVQPSYAWQTHIYDATIPEHAFHWILYERCTAGEDDDLRRPVA